MVANLQRFTIPAHDELRFFSLEGVLAAGQAVVVNISEPCVSLVTTVAAAGCNPIARQRRVRQSELRVLLSLLVSPCFCSDEVLLASLNCSWEGLLAGLFTTSTDELLSSVQAHCERLELALNEGTWAEALKPLYNVLYTLRRKLAPFGLWVDSSPSGYSLVPLPIPPAPLAFGLGSHPIVAGASVT